jgi:hypothetical protein
MFLLAAGCSSDDNPTDADKLCRGESGVGARISGTPSPVDICVPDDQTSTSYGQSEPGRYDLFSSFTTDGVTFEIEMSFLARSNLPAVLSATEDQGVALANPDLVWFFYTESKPNEYEYTSKTVIGSVTLTFSDETVAAGTFDGLAIELQQGGNDAGSRVISEGFFSVVPD